MHNVLHAYSVNEQSDYNISLHILLSVGLHENPQARRLFCELRVLLPLML